MVGFHVLEKKSSPFLPKSPKCLKSGQLAKVILKSGKIVVGKIRYVGPVGGENVEVNEEIYVGLRLESPLGDSDGSFNGRKFFDW